MARTNMPRLVAILEDDPRRIAEMRRVLSGVLPAHKVVVFTTAPTMLRWLPDHLPEVALVSLDHDLPLLPSEDDDAPDPGTVRDVADFLSTLPPTCPVIVQPSNDHCAPGMYFCLHDAGWICSRVSPHADLAWIKTAWTDALLDLVRRGLLGTSTH